ncbi:MAG: hypothetical protein IPG47_09525 [Thermoflexaceae bacterium]|nr:hypothetical protein [Thermoflexaceae bacterium]
MDLVLRARNVGFEVEAATVEGEQRGLGLVELLLAQPLVRFEARQFVAVGRRIFGETGAFLVDARQFALEPREAALDGGRLLLQRRRLRAPRNHLRRDPLERLLVLFAHRLEGTPFTLGGRLPAAGFRHRPQRRLAFGRRRPELFLRGRQRAPTLLPARGDGLHRLPRLRDEPFLLVAFAGDVGAARLHAVHVPAKAVQLAAFAFHVRTGAVEVAPNGLVALVRVPRPRG